MMINLECEVSDYESRLAAAMLRSNIDELGILIADDLLFVGPTGALVTKAADLDLHRSGATRFYELLPKTLEVRALAENLALSTALTYLRGSFLGNEFSGDFRYLRVWKKIERVWQVQSGSVTAIS